MSNSKTINIGIIGAGAIGINHIQSYKAHPRARVVALAETSPVRLKEAADQFGIQRTFSDYKQLLKEKDIQVVSVCLPNYLHAPVGLEVLHAGKHVLMEKPLATNARDAKKVVDLARRKNLKFMVGQNQRFTLPAQTMRRLVISGKLGNVYHAHARWLRSSGIPRIGSWFTQKKFSGGGSTYDIGVHALDAALSIMGQFDVVSVSGQTHARFGPFGRGDGAWGKSEVSKDKPFDVEDFSVALLKFKSGSTLILESAWACALRTNNLFEVTLYGDKAGVRMAPMSKNDDPKLEWFPTGKKTGTVEVLPMSKPLVDPNRMAHFVDFVLGKVPAFVKPEESLQIQKILDAIYLSAKKGKEIKI